MNECPKCKEELEREYVKANDYGGYDFTLEVLVYCTKCDFEEYE